eukprot:scaffold524_cov60-Skeletonema_dohrnii-CCMP3373.AAC.1
MSRTDIAKSRSGKKKKKGKKSSGYNHVPGKETTGETGIDLRHHTEEEIDEMSMDQQVEYYEWMAKTANNERNEERNASRKKDKKHTAAISALKIELQAQGTDESEEDDASRSACTDCCPRL